MDTKEIVRCALQIERFCADRSFGNMLTLLSDLDKLHITAEQLETTDIVKVLYRLLKTCSDDSVKRTAKSLLSKWKRQYSKDTRRGARRTEDSEDPEAGDAGVSHSGSVQTSDSRVESVKCAEEGAKDAPRLFLPLQRAHLHPLMSHL